MSVPDGRLAVRTGGAGGGVTVTLPICTSVSRVGGVYPSLSPACPPGTQVFNVAVVGFTCLPAVELVFLRVP